MTNITEGLQTHDLDYLIMPLISIDEYESKIDDRKAIVVGFYVTDSDPANELSKFIEKGVVPVLDTEVSPAPTEDGYYLVFIEMDRDDKFVKNILKLTDSITNLTNIDSWEFSPYHSDDDENFPLTAKDLKQQINLDPESVEITDDEEDDDTADTDGSEDNIPTDADPDAETKLMTEPAEELAEFLQHAMTDSVQLDENTLTLSSGNVLQRFEIVKFTSRSIDSPLVMPGIGDKHLMESTRLQNLLGHGYTVFMTAEYHVVADGNMSLVLKSVD